MDLVVAPVLHRYCRSPAGATSSTLVPWQINWSGPRSTSGAGNTPSATSCERPSPWAISTMASVAGSIRAGPVARVSSGAVAFDHQTSPAVTAVSAIASLEQYSVSPKTVNGPCWTSCSSPASNTLSTTVTSTVLVRTG